MIICIATNFIIKQVLTKTKLPRKIYYIKQLYMIIIQKDNLYTLKVNY